jgi:hydrogenase maturation protein HypF
MPGGFMAIKEPWRMAVAYAWEVYQNNNPNQGDFDGFIKWMDELPMMKVVGKDKIQQLLQMIQNGINTPITSSLGRLFDGVAALTGLRYNVAYEGQAALELEMAMDTDHSPAGFDEETYPFSFLKEGGQWIISPDSVIFKVYEDIRRGVPCSSISRKFHVGLVHVLTDICMNIRLENHLSTVAFSGGCFQNRFLLEHLLRVLKKADFEVLTHSQVPTNDGGLALGQAVIAAFQEISKKRQG